MEKVISYNKRRGETLSNALSQIRKDYDIGDATKLAYAGRLDPMASGLLLILVGEECKNRDRYQAMKKVYTADIILGIRTDTLDSLGILDEIKFVEFSKETIEEAIETFKGKYEQQYPSYSSYRVKGKPLFFWARENKLDEIEIPTKIVELLSFEILKIDKMNLEELWNNEKKIIELVEGDFRQDKVISSWEDFDLNLYEVISISVRLEVGSGFYVRQFANDLATKLGTSGIAINIRREKVGNFLL